MKTVLSEEEWQGDLTRAPYSKKLANDITPEELVKLPAKDQEQIKATQSGLSGYEQDKYPTLPRDKRDTDWLWNEDLREYFYDAGTIPASEGSLAPANDPKPTSPPAAVDPEYITRINDPDQPSITNEDGTVSTHRMAAEVDENGNWFAFPTIQMIDGELVPFEDNREAMAKAMETNNFKTFGDNKAAALEYAEGGYKKGTPMDESSWTDSLRSGIETVRDVSDDMTVRAGVGAVKGLEGVADFALDASGYRSLLENKANENLPPEYGTFPSSDWDEYNSPASKRIEGVVGQEAKTMAGGFVEPMARFLAVGGPTAGVLKQLGLAGGMLIGAIRWNLAGAVAGGTAFKPSDEMITETVVENAQPINDAIQDATKTINSWFVDSGPNSMNQYQGYNIRDSLPFFRNMTDEDLNALGQDISNYLYYDMDQSTFESRIERRLQMAAEEGIFGITIDMLFGATYVIKTLAKNAAEAMAGPVGKGGVDYPNNYPSFGSLKNSEDGLTTQAATNLETDRYVRGELSVNGKRPEGAMEKFLSRLEQTPGRSPHGIAAGQVGSVGVRKQGESDAEVLIELSDGVGTQLWKPEGAPMPAGSRIIRTAPNGRNAETVENVIAFRIVDQQTGRQVGSNYNVKDPSKERSVRSRVGTRAEKLDNEYGAYRYRVETVYGEGADTGAQGVDAPSSLVRSDSYIYNTDIGATPKRTTKLIDSARSLNEDAEAYWGGSPAEYTDENVEKIAALIADESDQLTRSERGEQAQWYKETLGKSNDRVATIFPTIETNPWHKTAFNAGTAIFSNGESVKTNARQSMRAMDHFLKTGKLPEIGTGPEAQAINKAVRMFNDMSERVGIENMQKFLNTEFTVKEMRAMGFQIAGELADTKVYGSAIFGSKIGQGFFQNLMGRWDTLTMDRWFMRTWGRFTGGLVADPKGSKIADQRAKFRSAVNKDSAELEELGFDVERILTDDEYANEAAKGLHKAFAKQVETGEIDSKAKPIKSGYFVKTKDREAARNLDKTVNGTTDAPANGAERNYIRQVMGKVNETLTAKGHKFDVADLQALLWYGEKDLYAKMGADETTSAADFDTAFKQVIEEDGYVRPTGSGSAGDVDTGTTGQAGIEDVANPFDQRSAGSFKRTLVGRATREESPTERVFSRGDTTDVRENLTAVNAAKTPSQQKTPIQLEASIARQEKMAANSAAKFTKKTGVTIKESLTPSVSANNKIKAIGGKPATRWFSLDSDSGAELFSKKLSETYAGDAYGKQVTPLSVEDLKTHQLFMSDDQKTGFAISPTGEAVGAWSLGGKYRFMQFMQIAAENGGTHLNAFDTYLPDLYHEMGFRETSRIKFDPKGAPEGWDFAEVGEPDIVFMRFDKDANDIEYKEGTLYEPGDDYDAAMNRAKDNK
jgi:hypothetical protein